MQSLAVVVAIAFSGLMSWALLVVTDRLVGLRVTREEEREGLDISLHGEQVF